MKKKGEKKKRKVEGREGERVMEKKRKERMETNKGITYF